MNRMVNELSFLLPLWEKVARTQSVPDEGAFSADKGFSSAEKDPSPGSQERSDLSHKGRGGPSMQRQLNLISSPLNAALRVRIRPINENGAASSSRRHRFWNYQAIRTSP